MTLPLLCTFRFPSLLPSLFLLLLLHAVRATKEQNVTIDDTDLSTITYSGTFTYGSPTNLDYGGNHQLSEDPNAFAKFTFTGTAVYMLSPKWPYNVDTAVSIDAGPSTTVDLMDHVSPQTTGGPETIAYSVVWSRTGLANTSHTVQVSRANNYVIVDGFIFTQSLPDNALVPTSTLTTSPGTSSHSSSTSATSNSSSSNAAAGATSSKSKTVPIAVGTVFGILGLGVLIAIFFLWKRRNPKDQSVDGASTWDKNAFAPQFANGGNPSPPTSGYYAAGRGSEPAYSSHTPTSATALTSSYNHDYISPQTTEFGAAAYPSVALGVGSTSSHSDYGRSVSSHPYSSFANSSAKTRESGSAYYNPYSEAGTSDPVPPVPPLVWNATSSQTSLLRSSNPEKEPRQVSYASESDAGGSSSQAAPAQQPSQPRYLTSQEEKAALYRQRHPAAAGPNGPRPPTYTDS